MKVPTPSPHTSSYVPRATTMDVALPAGATASSNELAKLRKRVALLERMRADEAALRALQFEENDTEDKGGILRMMRDESTAVPTETLPLPPPPVNPEKGKESSPVAAEEPAAVEVAPAPTDSAKPRIFGLEYDAVKMCTGVMNDVVGKMDAPNSSANASNGMFLHEVSLRSIILNQLFDNCDAVVDDVWAQCVDRFHMPATKESDRWWFDYRLSRTWTPDGPVVERTVMDAADALNALKTPSPDGSQDTAPRVVKRKPQPLELRCIAMGRDGPCTKRVSKERASIGKVTCGYHDTQEPDDDTDGEYEVIATPAHLAVVSKANTVDALTQSIGRVARASSAEDKKQKATDAVAPTQSKRMRWTDEEHQLFLEGIKKFGKGAAANRQISEEFVTTKTPSQVASHAQKYFLKVNASSVAPPEDSAMNKSMRGTVTANVAKSRLDLNNIVWVKTGKTVHWPGSITQIHDGNGQCKTNDGLFPSEFVDGKPRYVALLYDNTTTEPKTARNVTYFCPGQSFEKFSKIGKTPGFVRAVKDACHDYNESRRKHDKSKNITTAPEHLCIF